MKKFFFLLLSIMGLSVSAQSFNDLEFQNSVANFISSSREELPDPFIFKYEGREFSVFKSYTSREAESCYAYFTISPPQGCVGQMFEIRTVFVEGALGQWSVVYMPGAITTPVFYHTATGPFQFTATAIDAAGCTVTSSQPITAQVNPSPSVSISRVGKPCYNIFVANTNAYDDVLWSTWDSNVAFGPVAEFDPGNGYAYATVENNFGCTDKDSMLLSAPCVVNDTAHVVVFDTTKIIFWDTIGCDEENNSSCSGFVVVRSHPSGEPIKFCPSQDADGILTLQALVPSANQNTVLYQWVGQNIVGNTNKSSINIAPTQNQEYTLIIKLDENDGGCIFTEVFNVVIDCTTASQELDPDKIVIASSEGMVKVYAGFTDYKVSLVDITGREVVNQSCNQTESIISTDNLASGWYAVRIFADNKVYVKPIVVLH